MNLNLKGLVIGCGSIGERHLYNLKKMGFTNIAIVDSNKSKIQDITKRYHVKGFDDLDSAFSFEPDFSLVCTFPKSHLSLAEKCLQNDSHIFIEKPISVNSSELKKFLNKADKNNKKIATGYNLRFEPGLMFLQKKLAKIKSKPLSIFCEWGHHIKFWHPTKNFQNHYVLKKDGGIILDDSHEYDYVRWLLNDKIKSVFAQTTKASSFKTDSESLASIMLKFSSGTIATIIIDYMRSKYTRNCNLIFENMDLNWNYVPQARKSSKYNQKAKSQISIHHLNKKHQNFNFTYNPNDMYKNELENFLLSIQKDISPKVNGWEGLETLKIGNAIKKSALTNKIIKI